MRTLVLRLLFACLLGGAVAPGGYAADTNSPQDGPDLTKARAAIKVKKYDVALTELRTIKAPNADVYSLMGFALRKTGDQAQSMTYYRKALDAEPLHRGALEYQGELYVEMGQIDKAKENLAKLDKLCQFGCEEQRDLKQAIAHAPPARS
jgi:tetratricopeptide (TPR) repeat protein